jgi:DNA-binding XRE family transcriptional regulator
MTNDKTFEAEDYSTMQIEKDDYSERSEIIQKISRYFITDDLYWCSRLREIHVSYK